MNVAGNETIASLFRRQVDQRPDADFLVFEDDGGQISSFSYRDFAARVNSLTNFLTENNVKAGQSIGVMLGNCPEFILSWFAISQAGAVMVPVNILYSSDELAHLLNDSECVGLIIEPSLLPKFREIEGACSRVRTNVLARGKSAEVGLTTLEQIERHGDARYNAVDISPTSPAQIIYTSGTTSRPKGAVISHRATVLQGISIAMHFGMTEAERSCVVLPLFHVNGQYVGTIPTLTVGGTIVLLESFSARRFWSQIRAHHCTFTSIVPMILRTVLAQPPHPDDAKHDLRFSFYALPTSPEEWTAFEERFNVRLIEGYGLSETLGICVANPVIHDRAKRHCVGLPVLGREIRVVDETGCDVEVGKSGGIIVRGEPMFSGYFRNDFATRECIVDGWFQTGDNGYLDADGFLYFLDRSKDIIKRAGENIAAGEVERVLNNHSAVLESAVIGVFDPLRDEAVKAFVVLRPGADVSDVELKGWCAQYLANFKVPSFIEFIGEMPKTSIGKVMKYELRKMGTNNAS